MQLWTNIMNNSSVQNGLFAFAKVTLVGVRMNWLNITSRSKNPEQMDVGTHAPKNQCLFIVAYRTNVFFVEAGRVTDYVGTTPDLHKWIK